MAGAGDCRRVVVMRECKKRPAIHQEAEPIFTELRIKFFQIIVPQLVYDNRDDEFGLLRQRRNRCTNGEQCGREILGKSHRVLLRSVPMQGVFCCSRNLVMQ